MRSLSFSKKWHVTWAAGCATPIGRVQRVSCPVSAPRGKVAASPIVVNPAKDKLKLYKLEHRYIQQHAHNIWSYTDGYQVRDSVSQRTLANASPGLDPSSRFPASSLSFHGVVRPKWSRIRVTEQLMMPLSMHPRTTSCVPAGWRRSCHRSEAVRAQDEDSVVTGQGESSCWLWVVSGLPQARQSAGGAGSIAPEAD